MHRVFSLWRNLVDRDRIDRDLDEEVRATFALVVDEKIAAGMQPDDARRVVTLEMGRVEVVKEQVRDIRAGAFADTVLKDLRYGARLLQRNPVFAVTATLSLAIGIAAGKLVSAA